MRAAAVAVMLVIGAAIGCVAVEGAASATCPTPNPSQTSSIVGVQITTPSDSPSPSPSDTCGPGEPQSPAPLPTTGSMDGSMAGGVTGGTVGGTRPAKHAGPASSNTPQSAPAGVTGAPNPGAQPVANADPLTITPNRARAGEKVLVSAVGYAAGEKVQVVMYPSPVIIGSYVADSTGAFRVTFTVPIETKTGPRTIEAVGWISHHAANGTVVIISAVTAFEATSSMGWLIGIGVLILLLIVVSAIVFRSTIAIMFTPPRTPEPAS